MKKRVKLVLSDLHLGKGRVLENGATNFMEEFYFSQKFIEFLDYYSSGNFAEAEVELIINGDFLNFLQVDFRSYYLTVITESISLEKLQGIVHGHKDLFDSLKKFLSKNGNSLTYIIGNHDQSMLWPKTRAYLNEVLSTNVRYKNVVYFFDGVHIEHGHMHEAANRMDPKKFFLKKNLPEPILNLPFGSHFFLEFVLKVKLKYPHVDKIRPFNKMLRWAFFNETWFFLSTMAKLMWYFARSVFRTDPRRQFPLRRVLQILFESAVFPDLSEAARRILTNNRVHTVIFGHTHVYQYRQWGEEKEYFNTGTWTELTSLDITSLGKITKLTYVLLDYPAEGRPRAKLKEWRGYHRIEEDVVVT